MKCFYQVTVWSGEVGNTSVTQRRYFLNSETARNYAQGLIDAYNTPNVTTILQDDGFTMAFDIAEDKIPLIFDINDSFAIQQGIIYNLVTTNAENQNGKAEVLISITKMPIS